MISKVFTVYDSKAEVYMPPFLFQNKGEAIRAFTETLKDSNSMMSKYPQDFTLFMLGEFDNATAKFVLDKCVSLGNALEFMPAIGLTPDSQAKRTLDISK